MLKVNLQRSAALRHINLKVFLLLLLFIPDSWYTSRVHSLKKNFDLEIRYLNNFCFAAAIIKSTDIEHSYAFISCTHKTNRVFTLSPTVCVRFRNITWYNIRWLQTMLFDQTTYPPARRLWLIIVSYNNLSSE